MEIKGIKYIGPIFDNSGYAKACRGNILALNELGIPITLSSMSFENIRPDLGTDGIVLNNLVKKNIDYNIVIIHSTPEFWNKYREEGKTNVGYTIWETTKLHPDWPDFINNNVDKVLVGCAWNEEVFRDSGVKIPIGVVPHGINTNAFDGIKPYKIAGIDDDTFVFYFIAQWCYDEKTRVLTKDGFKYFKDLKYEDEIATLNKENDELEYHNPGKIVKFRRKDSMLKLTGAQFDVCVTPNHKMVVKEHIKGCYGVNSKDNWELKPLNDLIITTKTGDIKVSSKYRTKKNCKWSAGKEQDFFKIPKVESSKHDTRKNKPVKINMDVFLKFLGWYLSEGSIEISDNYYRTAITQSKSEENIEDIIECINDMGFRPIKHGNDILFNSREFCLYLSQFGKCDEKFIPTWIKNLSSRQIEIILTSMMKGDGSFHKNGTWCKYVTTSKKLAEDFQECLLKIGFSGAISVCDPTTKKPGKINGRLVCGKKLQYTVSVNRENNEPAMYYAKLEEVDYDGYVYCATVPNHTMLVERNGKIIFSGNTERKHPTALIKAYWHAFNKDDNVALVLKTYRSDYSESEKEAIRITLKRFKYITPMDYYSPIFLLSDMLSEDEMLGLHSRGDCYVSLDRGEGFGLNPFSSGACGNPIIVTGFGGVTEYAKSDNSYLVDYNLTPVFGMPWSSSPIISISCVDSYKKIKDVKEGDLVFNKNGNLKKVIKVADRPILKNEKMHSINHVSMHTNIEVTNTHKLYIVRDNKMSLEVVENITKDDYLVVSKPSLFSDSFSIDMSNYTVDNKWTHKVFSEEKDRIIYTRDIEKSVGIYKNIDLSEELFYLIGLYLSEGCVYSSNNCVSFSFNSDEIDTLAVKCKECLKSVFGISSDHFYEREYKDRKGYELIVNNTLIGRFFKQEFNTGSHDKHIPYKWRLNNNNNYRNKLLEGYWAGDGHISYRHKNQKSPEYSVTSASENLILGLRDLVISLDVVPSLTVNVRDDGRVSYIMSIMSSVFDNLFNIKCKRNKRNTYYYKIDDNHFAVRVNNNIVMEDYNEPVYSMSVEPDDDEDVINGGSYILNGIASSNSPWYRGNQLWAEPNVLDGANLMRHVYNNREEAKEKGLKLKKYINENFSWECIGNKIINEIKRI